MIGFYSYFFVIKFEYDYKKDTNGDVIYYTEGQAAKPFMYDTARQLERDFIGIAREVFGS